MLLYIVYKRKKDTKQRIFINKWYTKEELIFYVIWNVYEDILGFSIIYSVFVIIHWNMIIILMYLLFVEI